VYTRAEMNELLCSSNICHCSMWLFYLKCLFAILLAKVRRCLKLYTPTPLSFCLIGVKPTQALVDLRKQRKIKTVNNTSLVIQLR